MDYFIEHFANKDPATTPSDEFVMASWQKSLITSILSAGTFFGAIIAGDLADFIGRRTTVIAGCGIFMIGVILQVASSTVALLVVGRLIAGFGVGFVSAIIILYMSEIAPRKIRGAIVSGYQFCVTIGLMLASCVDYGTEHRNDSGSYHTLSKKVKLQKLLMFYQDYVVNQSNPIIFKTNWLKLLPTMNMNYLSHHLKHIFNHGWLVSKVV
ncbi:unnamed protein product [[Candida] boidinii]|nr:unnamed protein product [[Candida] boidinii]